MAQKQQTSNPESQSVFKGFENTVQLHEEVEVPNQSWRVNRVRTKGLNVTVASFVTTLVAVQLTLIIALMTPKAPVAPPVLDAIDLDQSVANTPQPIQPELPYLHSTDKRFMNGLEVAPAPANADPFENIGSKRK